MLVAKVRAKENVFTSYARRRRRITAVDGGSIPPISTIGCYRTLTRKHSVGSTT
jgi:hypothetical protein